ncbi:MAG: pinensin family lanthipeptide [Cyclobacteriaceae bacterium]
MKTKMQLSDLKVQSFITDVDPGKIEVKGGFLSIGHRCSHDNSCDRVCGEPHPSHPAHCGEEAFENLA